MIESSWVGLHATLALLARQNTTPAGTGPYFSQPLPHSSCRAEQILRSLQSMTRICGVLQKNNARDAFLLTLCTACVPESFAISAAEPTGGWKVDVRLGRAARPHCCSSAKRTCRACMRCSTQASSWDRCWTRRPGTCFSQPCSRFAAMTHITAVTREALGPHGCRVVVVVTAGRHQSTIPQLSCWHRRQRRRAGTSATPAPPQPFPPTARRSCPCWRR